MERFLGELAEAKRDSAVPDEVDLGTPLLSESRLVVKVTGKDLALYVIPTSAGWVGAAISGGQGEYEAITWHRALVGRHALATYQVGGARSIIAYGLLEDGIASVSLLVGSGAVECIVGDNGFVVELPDEIGALDQIRAMKVRYEDGRSAVDAVHEGEFGPLLEMRDE